MMADESFPFERPVFSQNIRNHPPSDKASYLGRSEFTEFYLNWLDRFLGSKLGMGYVIIALRMYEACLESKNTKVLNTYNIFNLQKRHCE